MNTQMRPISQTPSPTRLRRRARAHAPDAGAPPVPEPVPEATPEPRERLAGRPEDIAFYTCGCGYAFRAAVTSTVACPHCGGEQSW